MLRVSRWACFLGFLFIAICGEAQYKGDHIPGFFGLDSGTQAPPGLYVGNLLWVYPTSTVKDNEGNSLGGSGSLTSTLDAILLSAVTNYKVLGGNVGATVVVPFINNRIQLNSLDARTGFAFTDMFITAGLGWHLKRPDISAGYNLYIPSESFHQAQPTTAALVCGATNS